MPSIKGTASVADARERSKALKSTRFPANFFTKIKLEKINKPVLTQWIEQKVTSILGFDDEIVSSMAINLFLPSDGSNPDPRRAQLDLVGFLGEAESATFAKDLWTLLLEAQESASGIPRTLLEAKKKELSQQKTRIQQLHRGPENNEAARPGNNNPDMNRFVQEATRRAVAARHIVQPRPEAIGEEGPVPVPVSPQHPSEHPPEDHGNPTRYSSKRKEGSQDSGDRKMPARPDNSSSRFDRPGRYLSHLAPPYRDEEGYLPPPPPHGGNMRGMGDGSRGPRRSSQDRSRSTEYPAVGARYGPPPGEDEFRRSTVWRRDEPPPQALPQPLSQPPLPPGPPRFPEDRQRRGNIDGRGRRRYYSEDEEFQDLESRLVILKRRVIKRGDDHALDDEIEDIEDRLYEIDRRRRRRRRENEDDYRRRNRRDTHHRSRSRSRSPDARRLPPGSPPPNRSPGSVERRRRRESSESDASPRGSRRRRRSRSQSTESTGSSRSSSSGSVSSRSSKSSHGADSRRRSRSASSGSSSRDSSHDSRH